MSSPAISLEGVSKRFFLHPHRPFLIRELAKRITFRDRKKNVDEFWALRDVSFEVPKGQSVGLIGGNGAGKSTLLSLIIGSSHPTSGQVQVEGQIGALLELGAGFHPDLTGRENIILNASLHGFSKAEIQEKMDEIIAFTELERFIDIPIRNYSSGMHVRLGFSVAIHVNPDILIIDEALSVGDTAFQSKCTQRIQEIKEQGVTFLVVSHSLNVMADLCDELVWLDKGTLKMKGAPEDVISAYKEFQSGRREESVEIS